MCAPRTRELENRNPEAREPWSRGLGARDLGMREPKSRGLGARNFGMREPRSRETQRRRDKERCAVQRWGFPPQSPPSPARQGCGGRSCKNSPRRDLPRCRRGRLGGFLCRGFPRRGAVRFSRNVPRRRASGLAGVFAGQGGPGQGPLPGPLRKRAASRMPPLCPGWGPALCRCPPRRPPAGDGGGRGFPGIRRPLADGRLCAHHRGGGRALRPGRCRRILRCLWCHIRDLLSLFSGPAGAGPAGAVERAAEADRRRHLPQLPGVQTVMAGHPEQQVGAERPVVAAAGAVPDAAAPVHRRASCTGGRGLRRFAAVSIMAAASSLCVFLL